MANNGLVKIHCARFQKQNIDRKKIRCDYQHLPGIESPESKLQNFFTRE